MVEKLGECARGARHGGARNKKGCERSSWACDHQVMSSMIDDR